MRKLKSERPLSKRFAEQATSPFALRSIAGGALALTLAACGASAPKQSDVEAPRETAVPVATRTEPAPAATAPTPEGRRDRRSERRAAEEASAAAAAAVVEPVPETAVAAYARAVAALRAEN